MNDARYSFRDIAAAIGANKRRVERRAAKDGWRFTETTCRGGRRRVFGLADLPDDIQVALHKRYSFRDIAAALGVSHQACSKRARYNNWRFTETAGRGGKRRLFWIADLPDDVQAALHKRFGTPAVLPADADLTPNPRRPHPECARDALNPGPSKPSKQSRWRSLFAEWLQAAAGRPRGSNHA